MGEKREVREKRLDRRSDGPAVGARQIGVQQRTTGARKLPFLRAAALLALAVPQGTLILHTRHPSRSHPPVVWLGGTGAGGGEDDGEQGRVCWGKGRSSSA